MDKHVLVVNVGWTGDNFCSGWSDDDLGTVAVTGESVEAVKKGFADALRFHIIKPTELEMKVFINRPTGGYVGGLIAVAANSPLEPPLPPCSVCLYLAP